MDNWITFGNLAGKVKIRKDSIWAYGSLHIPYNSYAKWSGNPVFKSFGPTCVSSFIYAQDKTFHVNESVSDIERLLES